MFAGLVIFALSNAGISSESDGPSPELVSLKGLARTLFTDYLLPFEIIGLLLLVAVIGATVAARRAQPGEGTGGAAEPPKEEVQP